MIYVLIALLIGLAWGLWFILQLPLLVPLIASGTLVLITLVYAIVTLVHARRAASGLESALAGQAEMQLRNARPERRAEIQALQKQISDGIAALKASRLGGKKRGSAALYALPWYAIIGPPGAGKTTALRHSGLVFPYADSAIRGVGGTRNCDWWFTNEAILLDTAGRYATESEDQGEWLAFLDMLRKYRGNKPLNGLIVAVAMPDIIDANEQQIEAMAMKLRARIDEVMTRLRMVLPVYFLVTKCDLIAGFVEFFGGLRKSERAQPWGATIPLKEDKSNPGAIFLREFDILVQQIHAMAPRRLVQERDYRAREAIYQFPLEFAGIRRNMHDLIAQTFMVNAFQGTPTLRGFYFSSGTQEGAPLNRVLQRMGHAMGITPAQLGLQPRVEPKSYFLHDVFMRVVFPDAAVAARSAAEMRRQQLVRIGVGAAALAVALTFTVPAIVSYFNNDALLEDSLQRAKSAMKIDWKEGKPLSGKLDQLDPLLKRLKELDDNDRNGAPFSYRFMMYVGDEIYRPLIRVYIAHMQQGFVSPCKHALERKLQKLSGERYFEERLLLKQYLMLSEVEHLDVDWATGEFVSLWSELEKTNSDIPMVDLRKRIAPHVRYYFELIKPREDAKPRATPVAANDQIVRVARKTLAEVPPNQRYYALFVDALEYELWDPAGERIPGNMQFAPLTLDDMFADRTEALRWIRSRHKQTDKKRYAVRGPFTDWGHWAVLTNLAHADKLLADEAWVVPLTDDDRGTRLANHMKRLADDYEQRYIAAWEGFVLDLEVHKPANLREAVEMYDELQRPERPFLRILRRLEDHTQWSRPFAALENEKMKNVIDRKAGHYFKRRGLNVDVDVNKIAGRAARVPGHFKRTVAFGVPKKGDALNETPLSGYFDDLDALRKAMRDALQDQPDAGVNVVLRELTATTSQTRARLEASDDVSRRLLAPMLEPPLMVGGRSF